MKGPRCQVWVHVFELPVLRGAAPLDGSPEMASGWLPGGARCRCGALTWGEMNRRLAEVGGA